MNFLVSSAFICTVICNNNIPSIADINNDLNLFLHMVVASLLMNANDKNVLYWDTVN